MNINTALLAIAILTGVLVLTRRYWVPRLVGRWQLQRLRWAIKRLEPRERYVIENRFCIGGRSHKTLSEIGAQLNLTRERVRLVQDEAMESLKRALGAA